MDYICIMDEYLYYALTLIEIPSIKESLQMETLNKTSFPFFKLLGQKKNINLKWLKTLDWDKDPCKVIDRLSHILVSTLKTHFQYLNVPIMGRLELLCYTFELFLTTRDFLKGEGMLKGQSKILLQLFRTSRPLPYFMEK